MYYTTQVPSLGSHEHDNEKKKNQIAFSVCKGEPPPGAGGGVPSWFCEYPVYT